jgi:hypothetical protein
MTVAEVIMKPYAGEPLAECKRTAFQLAAKEMRDVRFEHEGKSYLVTVSDLMAAEKGADIDSLNRRPAPAL